MSVAAIRTAIKNTLAGVAGVGVVNEYERYARGVTDLLAMYVVGDEIKGWNIQRISTAELDLDIGQRRLLHTWRITGYQSWIDASQSALVFDALVESVADTFRADPTLGGVVLGMQDMDSGFGPAGIQVESIEPVMFAERLCHRAQLRLLTETTVSI